MMGRPYRYSLSIVFAESPFWAMGTLIVIGLGIAADRKCEEVEKILIEKYIDENLRFKTL